MTTAPNDPPQQQRRRIDASRLVAAMKRTRWRTRSLRLVPPSGDASSPKLAGWLTKTRKNSPAALFAMRRYFELDGSTGELVWYESARGRALGRDWVGGATIEHLCASSFDVSFSSGRKDHLRVEKDATPTAKEWVLALRTVALEAKPASKPRRVFHVRAMRTNSTSAKNRKIEIVDGKLRDADADGRLWYELSLSRLVAVERSRFAPQQLVLRWQNRRSLTLEFATSGDAETFERALEARSGDDADACWKKHVQKPSPPPRWLRIRICSWNLGNRAPEADLGPWLSSREGETFSDEDLEQLRQEEDEAALDREEDDDTDAIETLLHDGEAEEVEEDDDEEDELADDEVDDASSSPPKDDVVVVGCQDCTYAASRSGESSTDEDRGPNDSEEEDWTNIVAKHLEPRGYELRCEERCFAMRLLIFVSAERAEQTSSVQVDRVGCGGPDDRQGTTKGAIGATLSIRDTTFCFVSAQLESSRAEVRLRNDEYSRIVEKLRLGRPELDILNQFDHVFFFGSLNYRCDVAPGAFFADPIAKELATSSSENEPVALVVQKRELLQTMRDLDQLDAERAAGRAFYGFEEAPQFDFPPSAYRFDRDSKARAPGSVPSWCDRVLWKSLPGAPYLVQTALTSVELDSSDRAPVFSCFATRAAEEDRRRSPTFSEGSTTLCFDGQLAALAGPGLAPFSFRKPERCALRFFGRLVDDAQTDFVDSAACLAPRWAATDVPPLAVSPRASFKALRRSTLQVQLVDDSSTILGTALVPLAEACRGRGHPAAFAVVLTHRGLSCGQLRGALRLRGPLLDGSTKPPLGLAYCAAEALADNDRDRSRIVWRRELSSSRNTHRRRSWRNEDHPPRRRVPAFFAEKPVPLRQLSTPISPPALIPNSPLRPHRLVAARGFGYAHRSPPPDLPSPMPACPAPT